MRAVLSCLLMLTLVLRGLLGDAMAMGLAAPAGAEPLAHVQQQTAPAGDAHALQPAAHHAGNAQGPDQPDCAAASNTSHCGDKHAAHGAACAACGICHSAVGLPSLGSVPSPQPARQQRDDTSVHFASALAAPVCKPPIFLL